MYSFCLSDEIDIGRIQIVTDFNSKDALWLDSIVKSLKYTLGISLLIIMGLLSLFLCKRRRTFKSLNISQQTGQEFMLYLYNRHQNVDRLADVVQQIENSESIF